MGGGGGRAGRAEQWWAPEQLRAGVTEPPGPHGEQAGDTCRGRCAQHPAEGRMALFQTPVGASEG